MEAVLFSVQVLPVQVMEEAVLVAQTQEVCWLVSLWKKNHQSVKEHLNHIASTQVKVPDELLQGSVLFSTNLTDPSIS